MAPGAASAAARAQRESYSSLTLGWTLARRFLRDARTRTVAFAYLFAIYAYIQPSGYRSAYPAVSDRLDFARSFAGNDALRLFYGYPYDVVTVGGYSAWRVGGTLTIAAAFFGLLGAVRALRAQEDTGRMELVLAGVVGRRRAFLSAMAAIALGTVLLWFAQLVGFLAGGLPLGESAYLALATSSVTPVFIGVGAVTSQLAPSRRLALELGSAFVALALLLRVVADTSTGAGWLRWLTPMGWAELMRPFTGPRPLVLVLPFLASTLLLAVAVRVGSRRDVGTGMLRSRDTAEPRLRLLSTPTGQSLRSQRGSYLVWLSSLGVFAFILGMVSTSISSAGISQSMRSEIKKLGAGSITTPSGYLSFVFIFFVLALSMFVCAQLSAVREEESAERLETLLSLAVGRTRWLGGRLLLTAAAATALGLATGLLTWAGAASQGARTSLPDLLGAGLNSLPVALLFLGISALGFALIPRAGAGISYGLLAVAFIWQLVGNLLGASRLLLDFSPFHHVGLVPAQSFKAGPAAVMLLAGAAMCAAALWVFARRDLIAE